MILDFLESLVGKNIGDEKFFAAVFAGAVLLAIWALVITVGWYWLKIKLWKRLDFWLVAGTLVFVILFKVLSLRHLNDYLFDRLPIYALLSPKINFWPAVFVVLALFFLWLGFYKRLLRINVKTFLIVLILFSIVFGTSIALIRDGVPGLYETFLQFQFDYHGDAVKISDVGHFLGNFDQLQPTFYSEHARLHPPGFMLIHYLLAKIFNDNLALVALGIIFLGTLTLIPIYFLARKLAPDSARIITMLFAFAPAFVIFSAVSVDVIFLLASSLLFLAVLTSRNYRGWVLSGALFALTIFFQFIAVLFLPIVALCSYLKTRNFKKTVFELLVFSVTSAVIYLAMKVAIGYDIVKSFMTAWNLSDIAWAEQINAPNNFSSFGAYSMYLLLDLFPFFIYLSWPFILNYVKELKWRSFLIPGNIQGIFVVLGCASLFIFLFSGIFGLETERLWLCLFPLFVLPAAKNIVSEENRSATFVLLFLQIITTQIIFYTYW